MIDLLSRLALVASSVIAFGGNAFCQGGTPVSPKSQEKAHDDSTINAIREEQFLRGVGDLGLARALDDLESTEPSGDSRDTATDRLRAIARWRMTLKSPSTELATRFEALNQLRTVRQALIESRLKDPRTILWLADGAEDEFVLAFLGLEGGAEAIAGSQLPVVLSRANASIDRIEQQVERATEALRTTSRDTVPPGSRLAVQLDDDENGRLPMLLAAARALRLAIDRTQHDPTTTRDRPIEAIALLKTISNARAKIPARLRPESDLAEVAAASVAAQSESARLGSVRLAVANDPTLTTLARILLADSLVRERRGDEALRQLDSLLENRDFPTALRLLVGDAVVRIRIFLGKSPATEATLNVWIVALRSAQSFERAGVRLAVLERIAGVLRGERVEGVLPPLATIARARDELQMDPRSVDAIATLHALAKQTTDLDAQAASIVVLAQTHSLMADWPAAADDYRRFAEIAPQEPLALTAAQAALDIELALDRANPSARDGNFEQSLTLAVTRFAELPSRPNSIAQLEALKTRQLIQRIMSQPNAPSAQNIDELSQATARLEEAQKSARSMGLDPGPRVAATIVTANVAADFISANAESAVRAIEIPTREQWSEWTSHDAQRILRLRLERAARHGNPRREALERELATLPESFMTNDQPIALRSLVDLTTRLVNLSSTLSAQGLPGSTAMAQRALDAVDAWEALGTMRNAPHSPDSSLTESLARFAADAAFYAHSWDDAIARSESIASGSLVTIDDIRRLAESLSLAASAADQAGETARRDALRTRAMTSARDLALQSMQGSREWWIAQVIQLQIAHDSGRGGEPVQARLARLRAIDETLGGDPFRGALEKLSRSAESIEPSRDRLVQ